jgi:dCTP deaminase
MLSDKDILKAIEDGLLKLEPFKASQLRPAGISLHLGAQILVPLPTKLVDFRSTTEIKYQEYTIEKDEPFLLKPQQFVLGHTKEIISVSNKLGFLIEGRSTLARLGVSVEQSSTIVDPGHIERPITLEIYNCGPSPVTLYKDMSIARALVFKLSSPSKRGVDEYIRYAKQKKGVGKPILSEKSQ